MACATTSAQYGIGQKQGFAIASKMDHVSLDKLSSWGNGLTTETIAACTSFISKAYDTTKRNVPEEYNDINKMRVHLAMNKQKASIQCFPTSHPTLSIHLQRCYWQGLVWYSANLPTIEYPGPTDNGWKLEQDRLIPIYLEGPTSMELLQKYICSCRSRKKSCSTAESCSLRVLLWTLNVVNYVNVCQTEPNLPLLTT